MIALKSGMQGLRSTLRRRPAVVAIAGFFTVFLTPFVFFPEIMGDTGVIHASTMRSGAALAFLIVGAIAALTGSVALGLLLRRKRRDKRATTA